nr:hypothetical protein CFP56_53685 [Quercus suber]
MFCKQPTRCEVLAVQCGLILVVCHGLLRLAVQPQIPSQNFVVSQHTSHLSMRTPLQAKPVRPGEATITIADMAGYNLIASAITVAVFDFNRLE